MTTTAKLTGEQTPDSLEDKSFDKSENNNLFNRVQLRPFDLHSNSTSRTVSRKNSLKDKQNVNAFNDSIDNLSAGGLSINVSRAGSTYGKGNTRPPRIDTGFKGFNNINRQSNIIGGDFELENEQPYQ